MVRWIRKEWIGNDRMDKKGCERIGKDKKGCEKIGNDRMNKKEC